MDLINNTSESHKRIESTFQSFNPKDYLKEYYSQIGRENDSLLRFFFDAYTHVDNNSTILEFSGGPTLYQLFSAATKAKEIVFSEFIHENIVEVKKWQRGLDDAFDWDIYIKRVLQIEGCETDKASITERRKLLRDKLKKFVYCDAFKENPLNQGKLEQFDVVSSNFVAESIGYGNLLWNKAMVNILSLVKPGGLLIMSAITEAKYWQVFNKYFPAVYITKDDILKNLKVSGFSIEYLNSIKSENTYGFSRGYQGYDGMVFVAARKKT